MEFNTAQAEEREMDSYQPIYDAVRSRISGGNISDAVSEAIRGAGIDHAATMIQRSWQDAAQEAMDAARQHSRPSAVYRPRIFPGGKSWCALLGPDVASGVVGFGDSPELACRDFDAAWIKKTAPAQPRGEEDAVTECTCKFDADPNDPTENTPETSWHYRRVCEHCKGPWYGLHCPHDGVQNPCPHCGVVPSVEETK